jgi:hypothetical protein
MAQDDGYLSSLSLAPTEPALAAGFVLKENAQPRDNEQI